MIIDPNAPVVSSGAAVIKDGTTRSFAEDVIKASMKVPVVVDFWAPWCGPCKQLTPMLERMVRQAAGAVQLVKINVDENQELAQQLRVQSVPSVYAFIGGRPVDAFVGALSESQLRQFFDRLTQGQGSPVADALAEAQSALDAGDAVAALEMFQQVAAHDPSNPKALAGLIRARVARGDLAKARSLIKGLPHDLLTNAEVTAAIAAVDLAEETKDLAATESLRRAVEQHPDDPQARFDLARALYGRGQTEGAIDELLRLFKADRAWNDEAARKQLVKIFDALGATHPLTLASRRRLSAILFS